MQRPPWYAIKTFLSWNFGWNMILKNQSRLKSGFWVYQHNLSDFAHYFMKIVAKDTKI